MTSQLFTIARTARLFQDCIPVNVLKTIIPLWTTLWTGSDEKKQDTCFSLYLVYLLSFTFWPILRFYSFPSLVFFVQACLSISYLNFMVKTWFFYIYFLSQSQNFHFFKKKSHFFRSHDLVIFFIFLFFIFMKAYFIRGKTSYCFLLYLLWYFLFLFK